MSNYSHFNRLRNSATVDLEKSLKKVDDLAKIAEKIFKNTDNSLSVLCEINNKIMLARRSLNFNSSLWEVSLK